MSKALKNIFSYLFPVSGILLLVIVCMYHSSCHVTTEGIRLVTEGFVAPKIKDVDVDGTSIRVSFTKPVKFKTAFAVESDESITSIENFLTTDHKLSVNAELSDNDCQICFNVNDKTKIGINYELYACIEDEKGNTLSFTIPFAGENTRFPKIIISEINEAYDSKSGISEYVELYALTSGNLFGLELISASDDRHFELPCVEVKKGEYYVVELRKDNLSALNSTAEIVILNNKAKTKYLDCVMYCKKEYADENPDWKTKLLQDYAERCIQSEVWKGNGKPSDAVYSTKRKSISYLSRTDIASIKNEEVKQSSASCWCGTAKSKMSPGKPNSW